MLMFASQGQGLYRALGLPLPNSPTKSAEPILIYGGSTATGIFGIQYAKLSGLTVIATASPHNFDYLKSLGVDAIFDYKSPTCAADIKKLTNNKLKLAWDCMGVGTRICAEAMSDAEEGKYATIITADKEVLQAANPKVQGPFKTLAYHALGEPCKHLKAEIDPVMPEEYEFATMFWELSRELLAEAKIKPVRTIVNRGGSGLEGVLVGLDELKADKISGGKLIYTL
jgi:NADPH:quinone reductase-like Zn-dependent oxidoreductase